MQVNFLPCKRPCSGANFQPQRTHNNFSTKPCSTAAMASVQPGNPRTRGYLYEQKRLRRKVHSISEVYGTKQQVFLSYRRSFRGHMGTSSLLVDRQGCGHADIPFYPISHGCISVDTRGQGDLIASHPADTAGADSGFGPRTVADTCGQFADTRKKITPPSVYPWVDQPWMANVKVSNMAKVDSVGHLKPSDAACLTSFCKRTSSGSRPCRLTHRDAGG